MDAAAPNWTRYIEGCGSSCPLCGSPSEPVRCLDDGYIALVRPRDALPRAEVPCYCRRCSGGWVEVYLLITARPRP